MPRESLTGAGDPSNQRSSLWIESPSKDGEEVGKTYARLTDDEFTHSELEPDYTLAVNEHMCGWGRVTSFDEECVQASYRAIDQASQWAPQSEGDTYCRSVPETHSDCRSISLRGKIKIQLPRRHPMLGRPFDRNSTHIHLIKLAL